MICFRLGFGFDLECEPMQELNADAPVWDVYTVWTLRLPFVELSWTQSQGIEPCPLHEWKRLHAEQAKVEAELG